ncbi:glycogen debranching enzyme, partial [Actinomadura sp. GC306]
DWTAGFSKSLNVFLNGDAIGEPDRRGRQVRDDSFLMLINAHDGDLAFTLPPAAYGQLWMKVLDTADPLLAEEESPVVKARENVAVGARSIQVLRRV